ncbi:MAG TPA: cytosolic protein [Deltaproteobacteria bacterium]|nr:cytosolic protein [Deltaproteobacteria bacterium]
MTDGFAPEDLTTDRLAELCVLMMHQILVHHTLYFREAEHQFGMDRALEILDDAWKKSLQAQMRRVSRTLGFEEKDGIPDVLRSLPRETLLQFIKALGTNWLTADGIWFQAVERAFTMLDAERCAASCVMRFCTFEGFSIKRFLGLGENPGLGGLKTALRFRPYHQINVQTIYDEGPESIVFQMNQCIVQTTRKKKGLQDYPCKSTGLVEYRSFARAIDPRIVVECIGCPPDPHPDDWYCAWRFTLAAQG